MALFVLGMVSCGVGCAAATASVAGGSSSGFVAGGGLSVVGLSALIMCAALTATGAGLKVFLGLLGLNRDSHKDRGIGFVNRGSKAK